VIVQQNQQCDSTLVPVPRKVCPQDMSCINNVCRALLPVGAQCNSLDLIYTCQPSLLCHLGTCIVPNSITEGYPCTTPLACSSGNCRLSFCDANSRNPCMSNTDCNYAGQFNLCDRSSAQTVDQPGVCKNIVQYLQYNYNLCLYNVYYSQASPPATLDQLFSSQNCSSQLVQLQCAKFCPLNPEKRFDASSSGQYLYDCTAFTKTTFNAGSDCQVTQQFINCDLTKFLSANMNKISILFVLISLFYFIF